MGIRSDSALDKADVPAFRNDDDPASKARHERFVEAADRLKARSKRDLGDGFVRFLDRLLREMQSLCDHDFDGRRAQMLIEQSPEMTISHAQ